LILVLLISLVLWNTIPESRERWISQLLLGYFGLVSVIDMEHRLILHPVSITGAFIAFILGFYFHGLVPTMLGGFAGFAIMLFLYYLGSLFAKWAARRRGEELDEVALGFGDVNLAGICGLLLGWPGITAALMIAILLGGLVSLGIIAAQVIRRSYKPFMAIPYGPFLILGTCLLLYRALIS
jgi:leader peptidase (prepilin peptidase)/N-methyltransferase